MLRAACKRRLLVIAWRTEKVMSREEHWQLSGDTAEFYERYVRLIMEPYATHLPSLFRRGAYYVDRILKGVEPADLPIEQPTNFELVIDLKTAKARRNHSAIAADPGDQVIE